jgi:hypothetical protein
MSKKIQIILFKKNNILDKINTLSLWDSILGRATAKQQHKQQHKQAKHSTHNSTRNID